MNSTKIEKIFFQRLKTINLAKKSLRLLRNEWHSSIWLCYFNFVIFVKVKENFKSYLHGELTLKKSWLFLIYRHHWVSSIRAGTLSCSSLWTGNLENTWLVEQVKTFNFSVSQLLTCKLRTVFPSYCHIGVREKPGW